MAILLNNDAQSNTYFNNIFQQALDMTMNEMLDKLHDYIESEVYSYDNQWYTRSMQLLNNWDYTKSQLYSGFIESTLSMSNEIIHSGYPLYQHGLEWNGGNTFLTNDSLIEIVNEGKIGDTHGFPSDIGARPFWDKFIKEANTKFYTIFIKNCKKLGVGIK